MTTTAAPRTVELTAAPERASGLVGTMMLVRFLLRRDRIKLPAWAAGFGLFVVYLAAAIPAAYGTEDDLAAMSGMFVDPVGRMLTGPGYGLEAPTFERFIAGGYGLYFLLLAALMSILLVVRHTRVEEQTGRAELVRANVVGRHAPLTATLVVATITNLIVVAVVAGAMLAAGYAMEGSLLFAAGVGVTGLAFAGLAALTVQVTEFSRAAAGMAGAGIGAAFVLRAGGDMAGQHGSTLSWLSPLGWTQQTAPYVLDRWWPLVLTAGFGVVTASVGFVVSARRDVGASLLAVRPGRARAAGWLRSPLTLSLRLQRASIIGWTAALALSGLTFGAFTDALMTAFDEMPPAFVELFGAEDMLAGYMSYMAVFMAYIVGIFAVLAVQSLRSEETTGRAEPVLATAVGRWAWMGSHLVVTAAAVAVLLVVTGVATGLGAAIVTGDAAYIRELTVAHVIHTPAVLVVLASAALLFGVAPKAVALAHAGVAYAMVVGTFGPLLDLPSQAYSLSPFEHVARYPLESVTATPVVILTVIAGGAAAVGLGAFRRRGINAG